MFLIAYPTYGFADNLSDSNELFDWAETSFPQYFSPSGTPTSQIDDFIVRYYSETDIYIGTLENVVYIYGNVFGGLLAIGRISDFIQTSTFDVQVIGSNDFVVQTEEALELLKNDAPDAFEKINKYVGIIEQGEHSGMWAYENPPRYEVNNSTAFASVTWYAGTIAHDATHSELYHEYQAVHGVAPPYEIWASQDAELFCIQYQLATALKIGAPEHEIEYLRNLDGNHCDIDNDGDCDWDDYFGRDW